MDNSSDAPPTPPGRFPLARTFGRREFVDRRTDSDNVSEAAAEHRERPGANLVIFPGRVLEPDEDLELQPAPVATIQAEDPLLPLKREVRGALYQSLDDDAFIGRDDEAIARFVADFVNEYLIGHLRPFNAADTLRLRDLLLADLVGYGPLQPLLADPGITDILVNGPREIWVERGGRLERSNASFDDELHLRSFVDRILAAVHRRVDEAAPLVDARLPDGSRINVAIPPISYRFTSVSIRKFMQKHITLDDLVKRGSLSFQMATLLKMAARNRLNILVSGGTGAGKTTLLQAISHYASARERIVTIEDTAELQLQQPDVVSLEARLPNIEGKGAVTITDLLRNALRMRPDRIIVGEVRGEEAADMLQAMNTGHDGSFGTIHANSARDALSRFEYMVSMSQHYEPGRVTRQQIVNALDLVVHIERMKDGMRRVQSITEIDGIEHDTMLTRDLARFSIEREQADGIIVGHFELAELQPRFFERLLVQEFTGEEAELMTRFRHLDDTSHSAA